MNGKYDLIIIGAGPAGYVGAIRSAQLGLETLVIEKDKIGGTCLNRGCIPTKSLLHSTELYKNIKNAGELGVEVTGVTYDLDKIYSEKEAASATLRNGIGELFKANGIEFVAGEAEIVDSSHVRVGEEIFETKNILIATGSVPSMPPIKGIELEGVLSSDDILSSPQDIKSLTIIGGGVIGVEFAGVFSSLGIEVTILEALPSLLANFDDEISRSVKLQLKKDSVDVHNNAMVNSIESDGDRLKVIYTEKEKTREVTSERVLVATGRKPLLENTIGLKTDRGRIVVDENFETSVKNIYAVGDCIGGVQLAHIASSEAIVCVEKIAGAAPTKNLELVPSCVYSNPEIAAVGITEQDAKKAGIEFKVGKYLMGGNAKSVIEHSNRGFVKLIFDKDERIIGAHLFCDRATDMIGELATAIANNLSLDKLTIATRAHPTFNEGIGEACEAANNLAIHMAPKKKPSRK